MQRVILELSLVIDDKQVPWNMIALLCTQDSLYEDKLRQKKEWNFFSLFVLAAVSVAEGTVKKKSRVIFQTKRKEN